MNRISTWLPGYNQNSDEDSQEVEPEPETIAAPQVVMATSVDGELARLKRMVRSFDIENKELQRDLDKCHQKLKELSSQPVIQAELEPEPEPEDLKTRGWIRFVGVCAFPDQNTKLSNLKRGNTRGMSPFGFHGDGRPKTQHWARQLCIHNKFHGYLWARGEYWFTPKLPHRVSADEYLMDITDQHPKGESGNRKDAESHRDEVHLAPGASLDLLYQKIRELKDLDHTRQIKVEIFIEDQIDRENLIRLHPNLFKLIRASMKPKKKKKPKKTKKKRKKKQKKSKRKNN